MIILVVVSFWGLSLWGDKQNKVYAKDLSAVSTKTATKKKALVARLVVIKSNVPVYAEPNFDAPIIYQLPRKKQVYGSRHTIEGINNLGLFHKIRLRKGLYGYVLDTGVAVLKSDGSIDLSVNESKKKTKAAASRSRKSKTSQYNESENADSNGIGSAGLEAQTPVRDFPQAQKNSKTTSIPSRGKPNPPSPGAFQLGRLSRGKNPEDVRFFFRNYIGLNLGVFNYGEEIRDGEKSSSEWLVGLKMTGPNWLFKRFMVDLNVNLHVGAPKFFDDFSTDASGFIVQADLTFPFELKAFGGGSVYAGVGPLVSAAFYEFNYLGVEESSRNVRLGGLVMLGIGFDLGGWAIRFEPKYYFEEANYLTFLAGIQKRL